MNPAKSLLKIFTGKDFLGFLYLKIGFVAATYIKTLRAFYSNALTGRRLSMLIKAATGSNIG